VFYNEVTGNIVADYSSGNTNAVLFGKTSNGTAAGLTGQVAKTLKGYTVDFVSPTFSSGTITATLDTKTTKANSTTPINTLVANIIATLTKYNSVPDTTPPTPSPMTWALGGEPNAVSDTQITMTAATATDATTPPVQYYFTNKTITGHDSGWQSDTTYTDSGLSSNTTYTYTVMAEDSKAPVPNVTTASADTNATTHAVADSTPPDPNPPGFLTRPTTVSDTSITMTATTETDAQGVQYYFRNKIISGHNSGWQASSTYTDVGLVPDTNYGYTVQARDKALVPNYTAESNEANAVTGYDTDAPDPNPATFVIAPHATGATTITMQATIATDASNPVYYRFYRSAPPGNTFGPTAWQTDSNWTDTGLTQGTQYSYEVQTKDSAVPTPNTGAWSAAVSATTAKTIQGQINTALSLRGGSPYLPVTVPIAAGTYNESISINEPNVTLLGAGAATTIIDPGASYQMAVEVNGAGVTIDGFTINHGSQAYSVSNPEQHTIWVHANYSTIQNCVIDTNSGNWAGIFIGGRLTGITKSGGTSIWDYNVATGTSGHTIQNNTFHCYIAGEGRGIFAVKLTDNSLISGNTFNGDANDMLAWSTPGNQGGVGTAIQIHRAARGNGTHGVTIQNNTAQYLKYSFLTFTTEVPYNDSTGYMYTMVEHSDVNDVLVTGNTAINLGQDGIHTNGTGVSVQGGKKSDSYEPNTANLTIDTGKVIITGNVFHDNGYGVKVNGPTSVLSGSYGCVLQANNILIGTNNSLYNNHFFGVTNGTNVGTAGNQTGGAQDVNAVSNWWGDATGPYNATTNTLGLGNAVDANVIYSPYLAAHP
jgi:hypothetical protein